MDNRRSGSGKAKLSYRLASREDIDEFLAELKEQEGEYLEKTLIQMDSSWEEFSRLAKMIGCVWRVEREEVGVGYFWIEERGKIVHLHGILMAPDEQGKGFGTEIIQRMDNEYRGKMEAIELGVHETNQRAIRLYKRLGFKEVRYIEELGYFIMQADLSDRKSKD